MKSKLINYSLLAILSVLYSFVSVETPSAMAAVGKDFQAGNIINDSIFYNSSSMSAAQIQTFLNAKVPSCRSGYTCLKDYSQDTPTKEAESGLCNQYSGGTKSSAQIIYDVSSACGINPQVILTLLQKEQSLVTDTWPESIQYRSATGYGCPDTAACDTTYYGFFNQVYNAARQYKVYANNPSAYNYRTGRNNTILWNPNTACGSSSVLISSQSTAGLYNYTPYRPNQAALDNLYGTGDSCSSYGNRNFWRIFTDWFGSTTGGVTLIKSSSNNTIYAYYGNQKQGIPSQEVLVAWGLDGLPVTTLSDAEINAIPTKESPLARMVSNPLQSGMLLIADNGGFFSTWPPLADLWGYDYTQAATVGSELIAVAKWSKDLTPFFSSPDISGVNVADKTSYHQFSSMDNLKLWAGESPQVVTVSAGFRSKLSSSTAVYSNSFNTGAKQYLVDMGRTYILTTAAGSAFNSSALSVSQLLADILPNTGISLDQFVITPDSSTVYFVDSYKKYGFPNQGLLNSYSKQGKPAVVTLSSLALKNLSDGGILSNRYIRDGTTNITHYVNGKVYIVPNDIASLNLGITVDARTIQSYGDIGTLTCGSPNAFVKSDSSPEIYMLEQGTKRPIASLADYGMLNPSGALCTLNSEDIGAIATGAVITPYVSDGAGAYLLDANNRYSVSSPVATTFGLTSASQISSSTLARFYNAGALPTSFRAGNKYIYLDTAKKYYDTSSPAVATLWGFPSEPITLSNNILSSLLRQGTLTQFASSDSSSNRTLYIVDAGHFLPISSFDGLLNAGYDGTTIVRITDSKLTSNTGPIWQGYLAKNASGSLFVLGGKKYSVPASEAGRWPTSQSASLLSDNYLSLLSDGGTIQSSLKTSDSNTIYGMRAGKRYGFTSQQEYASSGLTGLTTISPSLMRQIPDGGVW